MKNLFLIMIVVLGFAITAQAQDKEDFKSKRGVYILPESGDIGLGFNAIPFFDYLGNMFNGETGNTVSVNFINNQAIVGKYYLSEDAAVRGELRLGHVSHKDREYIMQDAEVPDEDVEVTDEMITNVSNIHVGAGYEMRRGYGRVQGYFGGKVTFNYQNTNINYNYGNPITADFNTPNTYDFGSNILPDGRRVTEVKDLVNFGFGLGAFIGAEYFFAPKISIGGEFGWGFAYMKDKTAGAGFGEVSSEHWSGTEIETETDELATDNLWGFDTHNANGNIFLIFHF